MNHQQLENGLIKKRFDANKVPKNGYLFFLKDYNDYNHEQLNSKGLPKINLLQHFRVYYFCTGFLSENYE